MSAAATRPLFPPGHLIDGRYRVARLLGCGGMGEVYEAEDLETQRRVAIKSVLPELLANSKIISRFERESELSRRVSHPGVLRVFAVLKTEMPGASAADHPRDRPPVRRHPVPCMVMELLAGETLADRLIDGRLVGEDEGLDLACQMAAALTAAHRAGVVHRDLKPDNVFLAREAGRLRVVLTDFGVARESTPPPRDDSLTASNVVLGTPDYMAPEQLELQKATPESDIYTLGLVMFEMLTGERPFVADTALQMVFKRVKEEPPSPRQHLPDLDLRWETVILRCLARRPEDRYAEAQDVIRALAGDDSPWLLPTPADRFKKLLPWLAALVAAAAAAAALVWWL